MDINFELYKIFYFVTEAGSFSDAAALLFVSQSAVSQSIKSLEQKLGYPLFIRSTKKITLTPAGELLYRHIQPAVKQILEGEAFFSPSEEAHSGQLHIGASDTICRYYLLPYLKQFHIEFPDISIKVTNQTSIKCVDLLANGDVDLIVTNHPNSRMRKEFVSETIAEFSDIFIAGNSYRELENQTLTFSQLQEYPILMLDAQSATSEFLHRKFQDHDLNLVPEIELGSNDLLIDLARINLGIAFIPDFCFHPKSKDLFQVHVEEALPDRHLVASYTSALPTTAATKAFIHSLPKI